MKKLTSLSVILALSLLVSAQPAQAAGYKIDADHSTVSFQIKHLLSKVTGRFNNFSGSFVYEPGKPETWNANLTIQAESIDTNVAARDKHLRSEDFFDVAKFSTLKFESTGVTDASESGFKLTGNLTIHGVTKPVVLDVEILGIATDPWKNTIASFTAVTKINRKDFGLTWNQAVETGGVLVGEEVMISLEVAGLLQDSFSLTESAAQ